MSKISRPMQLALVGAILFAIGFTFLKPKDPVVEPVAATPVTPVATTPRSDAGGAAAESGVGKIVETAKNGAAAANADVKKSESQTGETTPAATATTPKAASNVSPAVAAARAAAKTGTTPSGTTPKGTTPATASAAEAHADKVTTKIGRDLAKGRAVVVLVWSKKNPEDQELRRRVTKEITRRGGKVRVYLIAVNEVGRYDGLLAGLALGQTPSTIVIAPDHEAKVLGGLTSTARIDRLTSSAIQIKVPKTTP
jgi:hypothetical protein